MWDDLDDLVAMVLLVGGGFGLAVLGSSLDQDVLVVAGIICVLVGIGFSQGGGRSGGAYGGSGATGWRGADGDGGDTEGGADGAGDGGGGDGGGE